MKKKFCYLIYLSLVIIISACKKNEITTTNTNKWSYSFNINGVNYKDDGLKDDLLIFSTFTASTSRLTINIIFGPLLQPEMLKINLNTKAVGTYHLNATSNSWMSYSSPAFGWSYSTLVSIAFADINITSLTSEAVKGTFSGKLYKDNKFVTITNGTFTAFKE